MPEPIYTRCACVSWDAEMCVIQRTGESSEQSHYQCECGCHEEYQRSADRREWCEACGNLGFIECLCGGDLCVCGKNGQIECEDCR